MTGWRLFIDIIMKLHSKREKNKARQTYVSVTQYRLLSVVTALNVEVFFHGFIR